MGALVRVAVGAIVGVATGMAVAFNRVGGAVEFDESSLGAMVGWNVVLEEGAREWVGAAVLVGAAELLILVDGGVGAAVASAPFAGVVVADGASFVLVVGLAVSEDDDGAIVGVLVDDDGAGVVLSANTSLSLLLLLLSGVLLLSAVFVSSSPLFFMSMIMAMIAPNSSSRTRRAISKNLRRRYQGKLEDDEDRLLLSPSCEKGVLAKARFDY